MSYRTDYARARGWGSAHHGVHHFIVQRMTALALIPLAILFVVTFGRALGSGYEQAVATYSNPWNALIATAFFAVGFWHLKLGIQVIFEDYVPERARPVWLVLNVFFNWAFGALGVFAVLKIAFAG